MPEFQRGFSVAYLNPAPPLDPKADSLYAVAPPPKDWSAERASRRSSASTTRRCSRSSRSTRRTRATTSSSRTRTATRRWSARCSRRASFAEGWAVYTEQMMLDQGYGDGDLSLRLHQLKFYLRAVLNAILDHKMHCANMTDDEAMKLLVGPRLPDRGRGGRQDRAGEAEQHAALDVLRRPDGVLPAPPGRAAQAGRQVRPRRSSTRPC